MSDDGGERAVGRAPDRRRRCVTDPSGVAALAERLVDEERVEDARELLGEMLRRFPGDPLLTARLGWILTLQRSLDEAASLLDGALQASPGHPDLLFDLAMVHIGSGDHEAAERCLRQSLEARPGDPRTLNRLGTSLLDRELHEEAERHLLEAARIGPSLWRPSANLGRLLMSKERPEEAVAWFERALEHPRCFREVHAWHAWALALAGCWHRAAEAGRRAVQTCGGDWRSWAAAARADAALGMAGRAHVRLCRAIERIPEAAYVLNCEIVRLLVVHGCPDLGLEKAVEAESLEGANGYALLVTGCLFEMADDHVRAMTAFRAGFERYPSDMAFREGFVRALGRAHVDAALGVGEVPS